MGDEVNRLDKAFEWVILFIGISYATIIQLLTWIVEPPIPEQPGIPPMEAHAIFAVVRLTFVPLLIIILIWLGKFISAEPRKMFFRKLAWSWGMFQLAAHIISTINVAVMDLPHTTREDLAIIYMILYLSLITVPPITYAL